LQEEGRERKRKGGGERKGEGEGIKKGSERKSDREARRRGGKGRRLPPLYFNSGYGPDSKQTKNKQTKRLLDSGSLEKLD